MTMTLHTDSKPFQSVTFWILDFTLQLWKSILCCWSLKKADQRRALKCRCQKDIHKRSIVSECLKIGSILNLSFSIQFVPNIRHRRKKFSFIFPQSSPLTKIRPVCIAEDEFELFEGGGCSNPTSVGSLRPKKVGCGPATSSSSSCVLLWRRRRHYGRILSEKFLWRSRRAGTTTYLYVCVHWV